MSYQTRMLVSEEATYSKGATIVKTYDYYGINLFAEDGSGHIGTYCNAHAVEAGVDLEAENVSPIFADSEVDYYPACEVRGCGEVFDYVNLTQEGIEYEKEYAIQRGEGEEFCRRYGLETPMQLSDMEVTRYDSDSGVYLGWSEGDTEIRIFSQDGQRQLGSFAPVFTPENQRQAISTMRVYVSDPDKHYGVLAGLWS